MWWYRKQITAAFDCISVFILSHRDGDDYVSLYCITRCWICVRVYVLYVALVHKICVPFCHAIYNYITCETCSPKHKRQTHKTETTNEFGLGVQVCEVSLFFHTTYTTIKANPRH